MKREIRNLKFLFLATGLLLATNAFSADVQMSIQPELISLLDRAVLKIEYIDTKGDAVDIPAIDGLNIQYQGPSTETRIENFKSSTKVVHSYVVTPTKVGDYAIGPVTAKYKGGEKELSAHLRVIKPSDDKEAQDISRILFSRIATDRESPYVHEPFNLELKVYVKDGVRIDGSFSLRGGLPENGLDGELGWQSTGSGREEVGGTIYNVYTLRATAETLTAGTFDFQPQVQVNVVVPRQNRRSFGFDDPFFGDLFGRQETRPVVLDCNKLAVDVKPIPVERRPASYSGGIGVFDFSVDVGPTEVKAGEPITIKMRVTGEGNIKQITPPSIPETPDLKLYDARTLPSTSPNEALFEQVVIPKSDQVKQIPPISFSYFNTKTADFRTLVKGPFPVVVQASSNQGAQVIAAPTESARPETEILGRDIVYLKPAPRDWTRAEVPPWRRGPLPLALFFGTPAALLFAASVYSLHRQSLANDRAKARRRHAPGAARRQVQNAERAMRLQDAAAFHEALWNALADYFGNRLDLAPGEISLPVVLARLPQGRDAEAQALREVFDTVERRRYGDPGAGGSKDEMKALLHKLEETLKRCERLKL